MSNRQPPLLSRLIALAIVGGVFAASAPADPLRIEARDGATVRLPNVTNITPQRGSPIEIVADGSGSQVELPALSSFYGGSVGAGSYLQASAGGHLALNGTLLQLSGGTELRLTETGTCTLGGLRLDTGAVLSGSGLLGAPLTNNGRVSPGSGTGSAGTIRIGGAYQQGADGVLAIELGGTAPGDQFDRLTIDQGAQLGGTLAVSGFAGFIPAVDSAFPFIASAARTGEFAQSTGLNWESGGTLVLSYSATGAALSAQGGGFADGTGPTLEAFLFNGTALVDGAVLTRPGELSLTATDLSGVDRIEVEAGGVRLATAPGGTSPMRAFLPIQELADGPHTLEVRGFDTAGNATLVQFAVQVALEPPPAPTLSAPADGTATIAPTVAVSGSAALDAEVILYRNDAPVAGPLAVDAAGNFATTIDLLPGNNRLQAAARNRAGTSPRGRQVLVTREIPVDLQVTSVEMPSIGSQGKSIQVTWQVRNAGESSAQGPWTDRVILSANAVLGDADDRQLGTAGFPAGESVAPGASYDRVLSYTLPADLPDGDYWIAAAADVENRVGAAGADKQRISDHPMAVSPHGPDLVVTEVIAPVDGVLSGSTTEVSFVVKNVGDRAADGSAWKDAIYLSADTELIRILEHEDLRGMFARVRALQPGEQYRQTVGHDHNSDHRHHAATGVR